MRSFVGFIIFAVAVMLGSPSWAEDTPIAVSTLTVDEIYVYSRKVEENLQKAPVTVTSVPERIVEDARFDTMSEFMALVPGASFQSSNSNTNQTIVLRGVQGSPDALGEPGFGLYRNGAYYGGSRTNFGTFVDIKNIEVARGPQGGIFGRNAVGGAINIVYNKPSNEFEGMIEGRYSRYGQFELRGVVNTPIIDNKVMARTAVWYIDRKGGEYFNTTLDTEMDKMEDKGGRVMLRLTPTDNLDMNFTVEAQKTEGPSMLLYFPDPSYFNPAGETKKTIRRDTPSESESDYFYLAGDIALDTSVGTFTAIATYREYDFESVEEIDQTDFVLSAEEAALIQLGFLPGFTPPVTNPPGGFLAPDTEFAFLGTAKQQLTWDDRNKYTFLELRWNSPEGKRLSWVTGFNFYQEKRYLDRTVTFDWSKSFDVSALPDFRTLFATLPILAETKTNSYSFFAEATFEVNDRIKLIASIRWTRDNKTLDLSRINDAPGLIIPPGVVDEFPFGLPLAFILEAQIPTIPPQMTDAHFTNWSPGGGIFVDVAENVSVYGRVNTGFRAGGFNTVPFTADQIFYDQEDSINYELGLKSELFNRRVRLNIALFLLDQNDLLNFQRDNQDPRFGVLQNLGDGRTLGLEVELQARLTERWDVMASFALMDPECRRCVSSLLDPMTFQPLDISGNDLPNAANGTFSFYTSYRVTVGNLGDLLLSALFRARWGGYEDAENTLKLESYQLLNLQASFEAQDGWYLSVYVDNVFDDEYNLSRITATNSIVRLPTPQSLPRHESPGRSYGVRAGFRF